MIRDKSLFHRLFDSSVVHDGRNDDFSLDLLSLPVDHISKKDTMTARKILVVNTVFNDNVVWAFYGELGEGPARPPGIYFCLNLFPSTSPLFEDNAVLLRTRFRLSLTSQGSVC